MSCCPFFDVTCCLTALLLSLAAFYLRGNDRSLENCCPGFRHNLNGSLEGLLYFLDWSEWFLLPFNVLATLAILLSNFECDSQSSRSVNALVHSFTSSKSLGILQGIALTSVLLQLLASEFLVAWTGVFYLLNHMCVHHQDLLPQAEQLLRSIAGEHGASDSWASIFSPIRAQQFEGNLNLQEYCMMATDQEPPLDVVLQQVWLAALLTTLSQLLMALALSGERQRAGVHEDQYSLHNAYSAVSNRMGQLGQNMQSFASSFTPNTPTYGQQILSGFKGRQGH